MTWHCGNNETTVYLKEIKKQVVLGDKFFDIYFAKHHDEILSAFNNTKNFIKLAKIYPYAANKVFKSNPALSKDLEDNDQNYCEFINKLEYEIANKITSENFLQKNINFDRFYKLDQKQQWDFVRFNESLMVSQFKSVNQVVKFIKLHDLSSFTTWYDLYGLL